MTAPLPEWAEPLVEQAAKALREMHGGISKGESWTDAEYILAAVLPGIREHYAAEDVYGEMQAERERAHAKHGDTSMEAQPLDLLGQLLRFTILVEEIGEIAREFNEARHRGDALPDGVRTRAELIQSGAMVASWADALDAAAFVREGRQG